MIPVELQFDMRAPEGGVPADALYEVALDISEWADRAGIERVSLMEHHATDDGYLPSPLVMGGAIAGRTRRILIGFSLLVLPLYNPLRLAEDIAVLDLLSKGRVRLAFGAGYRPAEFEQFGLEMKQRPRLMEEGIETLKKAWTGEPFEYHGRTVRILPRPYQKPHPRITLGGASRASAKRAAAIADNYAPVSGKLYGMYLDELKKLGKPAPIEPQISTGGVMFIHVSEDAERDWPRIAPYVLHDMREYNRWTAGMGGVFKEVGNLDELRATGTYRIFTPDECAGFARKLGRLQLRPLCGGMAPALAWESLKLVEQKVLPALA